MHVPVTPLLVHSLVRMCTSISMCIHIHPTVHVCSTPLHNCVQICTPMCGPTCISKSPPLVNSQLIPPAGSGDLQLEAITVTGSEISNQGGNLQSEVRPPIGGNTYNSRWNPQLEADTSERCYHLLEVFSYRLRWPQLLITSRISKWNTKEKEISDDSVI